MVAAELFQQYLCWVLEDSAMWWRTTQWAQIWSACPAIDDEVLVTPSRRLRAERRHDATRFLFAFEAKISS